MPNKPPKAYETYYVEWSDAHSIDPWTTIADIDMREAVITSVGVMVKQTKTCIALSVSFDKIENSAACILIIPKVCIRKMQKVKTPTTGLRLVKDER